MNLDEISKKLYDEEIIKSGLVFKLWVKFNSLDKKLKTGEYLIDNRTSIAKLTVKIVKGISIKYFISIPEGSTKYQLVEKIKKIRPLDKEIKINQIPDNLIADTYAYTINDDSSDIIKILTNKSKELGKMIWKNRDISIPLKSIDELFILSSIVEKETASENEKKIISRVFYNRMNANMRLQSDPTVIYAISNGEKLNRKLTKSDLSIKSNYNTYKINGLPPSPICMPGIKTLEATANPELNNFYYFVSNGNGTHSFSENYSQHLEKVKIYRELINNE